MSEPGPNHRTYVRRRKASQESTSCFDNDSKCATVCVDNGSVAATTNSSQCGTASTASLEKVPITQLKENSATPAPTVNSRKTTTRGKKQQAALAEHVLRLQQHYAEVDAYELTVVNETPPPPAKACYPTSPNCKTPFQPWGAPNTLPWQPSQTCKFSKPSPHKPLPALKESKTPQTFEDTVTSTPLARPTACPPKRSTLQTVSGSKVSEWSAASQILLSSSTSQGGSSMACGESGDTCEVSPSFISECYPSTATHRLSSSSKQTQPPNSTTNEDTSSEQCEATASGTPSSVTPSSRRQRAMSLGLSRRSSVMFAPGPTADSMTQLPASPIPQHPPLLNSRLSCPGLWHHAPRNSMPEALHPPAGSSLQLQGCRPRASTKQALTAGPAILESPDVQAPSQHCVDQIQVAAAACQSDVRLRATAHAQETHAPQIDDSCHVATESAANNPEVAANNPEESAPGRQPASDKTGTVGSAWGSSLRSNMQQSDEGNTDVFPASDVFPEESWALAGVPMSGSVGSRRVSDVALVSKVDVLCADMRQLMQLETVVEHVDEVEAVCSGVGNAEQPPTALQQLLQLCGQQTDVASIPSMDDLLGEYIQLDCLQKIGEGTFGEAFKCGGMVLKIVPMEGDTLVNGEVQKRAVEILAEAVIAVQLSNLRHGSGNASSGFVETHGVGVCHGRYSNHLIQEWQRWDDINESENDPVDCFEEGQLYVVFVVADGGQDLEHFAPQHYQQAISILLQATLSLAVAESAARFEHRDLHWGNLLIRPVSPQHEVSATLSGVDVCVDTCGVLVTLIDFTLSRLDTTSGETAFCDLSLDPELFKGPKNDCQADTYRRMRKATGNKWDAHVPQTNCMWLHYLAHILITAKDLPLATTQQQLLRAFKRRALNSKSAVHLLEDELFAGLLHRMG